MTRTLGQQLLRLRIFALCHGLAFHVLWHSVHIKEHILGGSYELFACVTGLQVVALWVTEALSGTLCKTMGSWWVLQACNRVRLVALACLGLSEIATSSSSAASIPLLLTWSVCEGVARALHSGSDVDLLYRLAPDQVSRNLAIQSSMWPLGMTIATLASSYADAPGQMPYLIAASWCAVLVAHCSLDSDHEDARPATESIPWHLMAPNRVWRNNSNAVRHLLSVPHLRTVWVSSLYFSLLSEPLNRLRPFVVPAQSRAAVVVSTFLGSFLGSAFFTSGSGSSNSSIFISLACFVIVPWAWWACIVWWPCHALLCIATLVLSVAFGSLKSCLQVRTCQQAGELSRCELLSTLSMSSQAAVAVWMCTVLAPLLDWQPSLLSPWITGINTALFAMALLAQQQQQPNITGHQKTG